MIGGTLVRFHPDKMRQSGDGFGMAWKGVKKRGSGVLRDFITEAATEGLKGLNSGSKGGKPNWRGGLAGVKRLVIDFGANPGENLTILLYGEFENLLEINENRVVIYDVYQ